LRISLGYTRGAYLAGLHARVAYPARLHARAAYPARLHAWCVYRRQRRLFGVA